ncbi:9337_t:CDS:2 [Racocetra persica]|uniref:9337_t:CDS:1 n=1 Tax=Racocetra persica TaxID=160502 RepID=A0ACA9PXL7_9GLOM|nr:9337_t:CDS:2 [Racocetra persica]
MTNEWTGDENEEVNIYKNTKNRIFKALIHNKNKKEHFEKLISLEDTKAAIHFKALEALMEADARNFSVEKDAEENINKLQTILKHRIESKSVFYRSTVSHLCSQLHKKLSNMNVEYLIYDNLLASSIILIASSLEQINEGTYVAEVLAPLLTTTFSELPIPLMYKTNWGEIESPSSKAHKNHMEITQILCYV